MKNGRMRMAKAHPRTREGDQKLGRPSLYSPKDTRPCILVTEHAAEIARAIHERDGISISDVWERALREYHERHR